jgi:elongation factor G
LKLYEGTDIRNVALAGHLNCGKTSLAAAILFSTGATNRLTRVDEGNTMTDFDDEEIQRKITISSAVAAVEWKKTKVNLIDTPGFNIFVNDARQALAAADSALIVVDGTSGVEVQTEKMWSISTDYQLPRAIVINKLDRERADFSRALESVQAAFGRAAVPIQLPLGAERDFKGVVDLISMKAYTFDVGGDGKGKEGEIPANLSDAAQTAHEALVEMVAEGDDSLMEQFFESGTLPAEDLRKGLLKAVRDMRLFPVLCASALNNVGTDAVLNFISDVLPAPVERPAPK